MIATIHQPGHPLIEKQVVRLTNRTGATLVYGSVGILDTAQADAASTTVALGLSNVVAVADGQTDRRNRLYAVYVGKDSLADDATGDFYLGLPNVVGPAEVDGTTDIVKGNLLKGVDSADHLVQATIGTDEAIAEALESYSTNGQAVKLVRWLAPNLTQAAD